MRRVDEEAKRLDDEYSSHPEQSRIHAFFFGFR
jgi:hypothetical protein